MKKNAQTTRVLRPDEYPAEITAASGAYRPDVKFAAIHPLGLYYVDHEGAGLAAYFVPKRKGSRPKTIGRATTLRGALARIQRIRVSAASIANCERDTVRIPRPSVTHARRVHSRRISRARLTRGSV